MNWRDQDMHGWLHVIRRCSQTAAMVTMADVLMADVIYSRGRVLSLTC
jgi:hypothetical protein